MDIDYVLDAGVAAVVANLTAAVPTVGVAEGMVSTTTPLTPAKTTTVSSVGRQLADLMGQTKEALPILTEKAATSASVTAHPVSESATVSSSGVGLELQHRLEEGLRQVEEGLRRMNQSPTVVIVNQSPPSVPSSWQPDLDAAVASGVAVLLFVLVCIWCLWLRQSRPEAWKRVKARAGSILRAMALPASWLCGVLASQLRKLHSSTEEQPASQAAVAQVRLVICIKRNFLVGYSYLHVI